VVTPFVARYLEWNDIMLNNKIEALSEVKARYRALRTLVYEYTDSEFSGYGISCREISFSDAVVADRWTASWPDKQKQPCWQWVQQYDICNTSNRTKRFDLAVYHGGELYALCYGVPTKRKLTLKIHTLARKPGRNPLEGKILNIVLFAATAYAKLLGCREIWLVEPMNIRLVGLYERLGYVAHKNSIGHVTHMVMGVANGY
jgi:hypothetical protein